MNQLNVIISLANMLAKSLGRLVQVTVSDTQTYLLVENPVDPAFQAGEAIGGNEQYFLENPDIRELPFIVNYKSLSRNLDKLRSSTFLFKNEEGLIEYMLSLTFKVDEFVHIRDMMDLFVNGSRLESPAVTAVIDQVPKLDISAADLVDSVVAEGQKRYNTTVERMTKQEKRSLLREMASRGVFLIKGAVSEAARSLNYSETTIYKFLQRNEKHE